MAESDRTKWDEKYANRAVPEAVTPNQWLVENRELLPPGTSLDLACGLGHNAVWLADQGWQAEGWDISSAGLQLAQQLAQNSGVDVAWQCCDLDEVELPPARYDVIVCTAFRIEPPLAEQIVKALRPHGVLVYEAFTRDQLHVQGNHFRDDRFLMAPGEPLSRFGSLRVRRYRDLVLEDRAVASLVAECVPDE